MIPEQTDATRILTILRRYEGEWVADLYGLTHCMVHSRIADLRRRGYRIDCKRFARGDYRYRLVDDGLNPPDEFYGLAEPAHWDERGMLGG